jgi:2-amino-4-hydroxy-6-hydroxymethyldihydropteridine diphosphokinase/dihydropteroate synthase
MSIAIIGLGSNLNQPLIQLRRACNYLQKENLKILAYSDIYQTAPLLPNNAPVVWAQKPYLNAAIKIETSLTPEALLQCVKNIEHAMGRTLSERWAPRLIDLDILLFDQYVCNNAELQIPHAELHKRAFALAPLLDVLPEYQHPEIAITLAQQQSTLKKLPQLLAGPQIMGILNVTPDSFADGGKYLKHDVAIVQAQKLFDEGADIIDIGAESTRPGAQLLDPTTEWQRLETILPALQEIFKKAEHRPLISLDTRHTMTVKKAMAFGIDWINDVSQEEFMQMLPLIKEGNLRYIAMHHLGVPPQPTHILKQDPIMALKAFEQHWVKFFEQHQLPQEQLLLDPGIGFGKSVMQQVTIIKQMQELLTTKTPWVVGHSRKSFLKSILPEASEENKETATAIISTHLAAQGVNYIRVHAPGSSLAAIRLQNLLSST